MVFLEFWGDFDDGIGEKCFFTVLDFIECGVPFGEGGVFEWGLHCGRDVPIVGAFVAAEEFDVGMHADFVGYFWGFWCRFLVDLVGGLYFV